MSAKSETLYLKIDQNTIVTDRHVTLGDIAKMECPDASIVRQLKQKKNLYVCGGDESAQTEEPDEGIFPIKDRRTDS